MTKRKLIQCATTVNKDAVRRESIDGVEHIIVSSFTLPDNIVMNGGLYPAEEVEKSYKTLERTLAPVEHPQDSQGNYISASDPIAIHNYHAGAFNQNVIRENGRVHIDKYINVQEAMKSDKGLRLLDRINELETSESPRPIHTSVGVWIDIEEFDQPMTNESGQEYTWSAKDMVFDHDAILLDSVGAARPEQGVGIAVNSDGKEFEVETFVINEDKKTNDLRSNVEGVSLNQITEQLHDNIKSTIAAEWVWVVDLFDEDVIFEVEQGLFTVPYRVDDGIAQIVGIPVRVGRVVTYNPKVNSEGEVMKQMIINALAEANIETEGLTDEQLFKAYNEMLQANESQSDDNGADDNTADLAEVVANALKPVTEELAGLKAKFNEQTEKEHSDLVSVVVNSGKFAGLDEEGAKMLTVEKLKAMAANCGSAHGIPLTAPVANADDSYKAPAEMAE